MEMKTCTRCGQTFPATTEYFHKVNSKTGKLRANCRVCTQELNRERYKRNKEKYNKTQKAYWQNNKEKIMQYREEHSDKYREAVRRFHEKNPDAAHKYYKEHYEKHKEKIIERTRKYKEQNVDKLSIWKKQWTERNRERIKVSEQRRKSLKRSLPSTLTVEQWIEIKNYFNNKCAYCGKEKPLTQDHFIPVIKKGEYTHNNIIPACNNCNCSKSDSDFFVWYPKQKFYSKARERKILDYLGYKDGIQQLSVFNLISKKPGAIRA